MRIISPENIYIFKTSYNTEEKIPSKRQCTESLQITREQRQVEMFANFPTSLKLYMKMPIMSYESKGNLSNLYFMKNKNSGYHD